MPTPDETRQDEDDDSGPVPLLRSILPEGYENAQRHLDDLFAPAERDAELHPYAEPLHEWLTTLLLAEYFGETPAETDFAGENDDAP